jgi:putative hydrolase of the HAD superfamily
MSDAWRIHTIVFDLDDTLYPEREFVLGGFAAVGAWLRESHGIEGFEDEARRLFAAGRRGRIFDEALERLRAAEPGMLVPQMVRVYREHQPRLRLFPDAEDTLAWAQIFGLRLAIVTDGFAAVQRNKIIALGLGARIPCCVITDELGGKTFWKPHQEAFLRVMAELPGPPSGFVYVADNPRKDFIAPRQLGWKTLRVRRPEGEHTHYEATDAERADEDSIDLAHLRTLFA